VTTPTNDEPTTPQDVERPTEEANIAVEEFQQAEIASAMVAPSGLAPSPEDVVEPLTTPIEASEALEELHAMVSHQSSAADVAQTQIEATLAEFHHEHPAPPELPVKDIPSTPAAPEPVSSPVAEAPVPVAPAEAPASVQTADDSSLFEKAMASLENPTQDEPSYKRLSKGDRIEATVIQVERDRVFVDLGTKSEGVVPLGELTEENLETAEGHVKAGDKIQVVVLRPEGAEGNPIVSKKRAEFEEAWNRIVESFTEGKTLTAQVVDRVKGGLVVDIGVRGFVPATHVGNGRLRNIEKYVGESIPLKIIEIDRDRKKVVLSNRQAEEERRSHVRDEIFTKVAPGDTLEGTVRRLTEYGAFVDLGGIDGLLHISEMSWMRINHPREVLKENEKIKVMVLRLDPQNSKISLGLRQVLPDPWNLIRENYKIGQKFTCKIGRLVQSGAFVKLPEGAEAFLPISEMSNRRIGKPSDVLEEGQEVELTIIDLRPDERRMVLSLRGGMTPSASYREPQQSYGGDRGGSGGYDDDMRGKKGPKKGGKKRGGGRPSGRGQDDDDFESPIVGRVPTGGATIGERLGILKGFLGRGEDEDELEEETMVDEAVASAGVEEETPETHEKVEESPEPEQPSEAAEESSDSSESTPEEAQEE